MLKLGKLTGKQEACLREQAISEDQPGTVLHDFQVLLDRVGVEGLVAAGKYNLLPIDRIQELDQCLSRPLNLNLQRPQLRSHPYLQGLHLLLRASGLVRVDTTGKKARLVVDPEMRCQWDGLNATERYFNLLEAWLRFGRREMVGLEDREWNDLAQRCVDCLESIPESGRSFKREAPQDVTVRGIYRDFYLLALMDLFGLVTVEQRRPQVTPWAPGGIRRTAFADAVLCRLASGSETFRRGILLGSDDADEAEEGAASEQFGAWQPLFQPYFPDWRENLHFPEPEDRDGTLIFRVSLPDAWRRIAVPADADLDDLVAVILESFRFDDDHLYQFTYRNSRGAEVTIVHPDLDGEPTTTETRVGSLPLAPGDSMALLYDFGDNWVFHVTLERVDPPGKKTKAPRVLERHGKAPRQYEDADVW
jgi:Plasmid pRiA4b ORF-3-like protein